MRYLITEPSNEYYLSEEDVTLKEAIIAEVTEYGMNNDVFVKCLNVLTDIEDIVYLVQEMADIPITGIYEVTNRLY